MIILISLILILFSVIWVLIWRWFFQKEDSNLVLIKLCKKHFKIGDYKKVKELLSEIKESDFNSNILHMLGVSNLKLGKYEEAKGFFEKILSSSPKDIEALSNLAKVYEEQNNYEEAIEQYNKVLNENNKDLDSYLNIANIFYEQENYSEALSTVEKAKEIAPNVIKVLCSVVKYKICLCDSETQEYQKLIKEYASFDGKKDLPLDYNLFLAQLYAKNGNMKDALKHSLKATEIKEQGVEAYKLLGLIKLIKKDITGAKESLSIALNLQPSNLEIHNIFSYLLCTQDNYCEKEKCRQKYFKLVEKYIK